MESNQINITPILRVKLKSLFFVEIFNSDLHVQRNNRGRIQESTLNMI